MSVLREFIGKGLNERIVNALANAGVLTLDDLRRMKRKDLLRWTLGGGNILPNFSKKSYAVLSEFALHHGIFFEEKCPHCGKPIVTLSSRR